MYVDLCVYAVANGCEPIGVANRLDRRGQEIRVQGACKSRLSIRNIHKSSTASFTSEFPFKVHVTYSYQHGCSYIYIAVLPICVGPNLQLCPSHGS